ncbi:MAG: hypothetical protein QOJ02_4270 [Acidobacteriota bacterium]|nr:hypothetical protein [Acidobacteriota bacterium]
MNWSEVVNELDNTFPFLARLGVYHDKCLPAVQVPPILRISTSIAIKMLSARESGRRVALVFPKSCGSAKWLASGAAIATMLADFADGYGRLPPLKPGDRLLGDGRYIAEYIGIENIDGEEFLKLRLGGNTKGSYLFPARQRMRLQHTSSKRQLSSRPMPQILPDPLDGILGVATLGNRSIYKSSVVLVSSIGVTKEWGHETLITCLPQKTKEPLVPIINLFQWGGIDHKGELEHWGKGQFTGKPTMAVASDLFAVEEYLTGEWGEVRLIVIDGGARFSRDIQLLDEILDTGLPVLTVIDSDDANDVALLRDRGFDFWTWNKDDLSNPITGACSYERSNKTDGPFSAIQKTLGNFRDFSVNEISCSDSNLESAETALFELDRQIESSHEQIKGMIGQLYGSMLSISRLLRPLADHASTEWRKHTEERLKQIEQELIRNRAWLSPSAFATARALINELLSALNSVESCEAKVRAFEDIVARKIRNGTGLLGVIVGSVEEISLTSQYWKKHLGDFSRLIICSSSTFDETLDYDALIVCGWLGSKKMVKLLHSYAAPEIYVLSNQFESKWLKSIHSKLQRSKITQSLGVRERLLGVKIKEETPPYLSDEQISKDRESPDISEFELRLRFYKRQALAAVRTPDENTAQARFVEFTDGHFAFLSEHYHVPVVTNYIKGVALTEEIPQRTVAKIKPGDFLLFKESAEGNLIKTVADLGLVKSGKGHLRRTASLWREALQAYHEELNNDTAAVVQELKELGCRKKDITIRRWIDNNALIAPRHYDDIRLIAAVTGNLELEKRLEEVRVAIREVRGAHLQASDYLVKRLLESATTCLTEAQGKSFSIEIEDIGRAVVIQVEEISDEILTVGHTRVNRLLKEAKESMWHA